MDLSCLLSLIRQVTGYQHLKCGLFGEQSKEVSMVVSDAARPFVIAALHKELQLPILVIISQPEEAKKIYDELQVWCSSSTWLQLFPETDLVASTYHTSDFFTASDRLRTLSALSLCRDTLSQGQGSPLIISSALAAIVKTMPRGDFVKSCHTLAVGMPVELFQLVQKWQDMGYKLESVVEVPGTIRHCGGILDVFSPNSEFPARIELVGNNIESIRLFDPKTQRSVRLVESVTIVPVREGESRADTILSYLPDDALLITDNLNEIKAVVDKLDGEAYEFIGARTEQDSSSLSFPVHYSTWAEFETEISKAKRHLTLCSWVSSHASHFCVQSLPFTPVPSFGGRLDIFCQKLKDMLTQNERIVIVSQQMHRLTELLQEQGLPVNHVVQIEQPPSLGVITLVKGSLNEGWALKDVLTLFTDKEIFGFIKQRRWFKHRPVRHHLLVSELRPGDYVVHIEHGIAKFAGLTRMFTDGVEREYIVLEYAAGDRLYVPTDQADRVSRYIGTSDQPPSLSRLGTQEWARTKQRIKESVANVAQELLNLYAAREVIPGFAFSRDSLWQQELESSFPYVETIDQLEAVKHVKDDMEKPRPMDRLVCGDVGYGKTEVALRAAFKAVMDGKQVALLVPTTVLAQQHFATFKERLQAFPVRVEMLSRFCSRKEQANIIEGLAAGTVDICIGTHRLLQKDVVFKDLGLLIIDEEQRFGVVHKEHFKKLRREIDVLTLSATPIPRTLHMAITGIRDMSTIETPPEERLPIKTYVGAYDERLVREAILHELERNGQVFFVHNRVHSIGRVANRLCSLVPEARISIAHGQMPEDELAEVIAEFLNRKSDVLVTTTIIESGLDMPNVNTLIVDQADRLGLTQLYQLRGRVGRGSNSAYAYFFVDGEKQMTTEARKRLSTIAEATELGAGFAIAMKDLEIRGAGNLLGVEQSGYIAAVGFDLYCRLLAEAVEEAKQKQTGEIEIKMVEHKTSLIALPISAYIPEGYISSLSTRLNFYQRLATIKRAEEIEDTAMELCDRFGPMPQPVANLLYVVEIRQLASAAGVESIFAEDKQLVLQFANARGSSVASLLTDFPGGVRVGTKQIRLDIKWFGDNWRAVLKGVLQRLTKNTQH